MAQFSRQHVWLATALAAGLIAVSAGTAPADNFNSGTNSSSGQINTGGDTKLPAIAPGETGGAAKQANPSDTSTPTNAPLPTYQEAERALMAPDSPDPSPGRSTDAAAKPPAQTGASTTGQSTGSGAQADTAKQIDQTPAHEQGSMQAIGGAMAPGASAAATPGADGGQMGQGGSPAASAASIAAAKNGPIGATTQTAPSLVSERNRTLDRVPILAMPIRLDDAAQQKIRAAAKELGEPVQFNGAPASAIPAEIAFTAMRDLPADIGQALPLLQGRKLIRTGDKILIVNPRTRVVVGEVSI
ncbi:MAG: hypothetical protein ACTHLY_11140 [Pseudolabrys sp.]